MTSKQPQHRLVGFGSNYFYALGGASNVQLTHDGSSVEGKELKNVPWNESDPLQQMVCTTSSSLFLTKSGQLFQVGTIHGNQRKVPTPLQVRLPIPVSEIAAGRHFCLARCGVAVVSWGAGHFGQLGHGPSISVLETPEVVSQLLPQSTGGPIVKIACGAWHACALTEEGKLFCWGSNRRYQCGSKSPTTLVYPECVSDKQEDSIKNSGKKNDDSHERRTPRALRFSELACGKAHTLALEKNTGKVYSWGASVACGHSSRRSSIAPPRMIDALQRVVIVDIAAGESHSLALTGGGRVFGWGAGLEGQLGMSTTSMVSQVPRPKLVSDLDFVAIVAGQQFKDQPLLMGSGSTTRSQVSQILPHVPKIVQVHAAGSYSVARSSTGHVYAWGYNDGGVLGVETPRVLPTVENTTTTTPPPQSPPPNELRKSDAKTFDSRHNVLVPKRLDCLENLSVDLISGGPSHLWIYGSVRNPGEPVAIGRTLFELEMEQKRLTPRATETVQSAKSTEDSVFSNTAITVKTDGTTTVSPQNIVPPSPMFPLKPSLNGVAKFPSPPVSPTPTKEQATPAVGLPPVTLTPRSNGTTPRSNRTTPKSTSAASPSTRVWNSLRQQRHSIPAPPLTPPDSSGSGYRRQVRRHMSMGKLMRRLVPKKGDRSETNKTESNNSEPKRFRRVLTRKS